MTGVDWSLILTLGAVVASIEAALKSYWSYKPHRSPRWIRYRILFATITPPEYNVPAAILLPGTLCVFTSILGLKLSNDGLFFGGIVGAIAYSPAVVVVSFLILFGRYQKLLPRWRREQLERGLPFKFPRHPDDASIVDSGELTLEGTPSSRTNETSIAVQRWAWDTGRTRIPIILLLDNLPVGQPLFPGQKLRVDVQPGAHKLRLVCGRVSSIEVHCAVGPASSIDLSVGHAPVQNTNFERAPDGRAVRLGIKV